MAVDIEQRDLTGTEFARAVRGDRAAFAAFLARFERRIARVVRSLVPGRDAEDIFQEVVLRLLAKGHQYDAARPLTPWLDAVTRSVCLLSRRKRTVPTAEVDPAAPDAGPGDPFVRDIVHAHLSSLPARERRVVRLVLLHGLTQREAARRTGVPPGTVATWLARTVRKLRGRLGGGL